MPNYQNALSQPIFKTISQAADALGVETYVIGGFVRDYILKRDTSKDIDVVAVGSGITLARKVSQLLPNTPKVQVFKTYGTAMLRYNDIEIEFILNGELQKFNSEIIKVDKSNDLAMTTSVSPALMFVCSFNILTSLDVSSSSS